MLKRKEQKKMPANKQTHSLYNGEIKIDFYPDSHRYKLLGEKTFLISATAVTGMLDKSQALIPWAVNLDLDYIKQYLEERAGQKFTLEELEPIIEEARKKHTEKKEEAATNGSIVHDYAERFARSIMDGTKQPEIDSEWPEQVLQGISAFLEWFNANDVHFHATESLVYSKKLKIVGTADAVASVNGEHVLIDYKTSKGVYSEYHYQAAGYFEMWNEEHKELQLTGAKILHFSKEDGSFNVVDVINLKEAVKTFKSLAKSKENLKEYNKLIGAW